jgi:hypothetical protein
VKKTGIAAIIVAALAGAASLAAAGSAPSSIPLCCACIENTGGLTAQIEPTGGAVFFCAAAPDGNTTALGARCKSLPNDGDPTALLCTEASSNTTCRQDLAGFGIACPNAGVPAANPLNLATLAVVLGAAGALLLRRRARREA